MFYLVYKEHCYDAALGQLAEIFYFDINSRLPFVAPGIVNFMQECAERLGISGSEVYEQVQRRTLDICSERRYVDENDVAGIIALLISRQYDFAKQVLIKYPEIDLAFFEKLR